jgi:uncharacterized C2H2 Zn-finger protein
MAAETGKAFKCEACGMGFSSREELDKHNNEMH